jgi:hypothetical protein
MYKIERTGLPAIIYTRVFAEESGLLLQNILCSRHPFFDLQSQFATILLEVNEPEGGLRISVLYLFFQFLVIGKSQHVTTHE